jgi:hypothetical protein
MSKGSMEELMGPEKLEENVQKYAIFRLDLD